MNNVFTIKSFLIDHDKVNQGIYISRVDGDIFTYDIRFIKPNSPPYMDNSGIHTIEHLMATYMRNSSLRDSIIYVGPMGCRTGFYLLVKNLNPSQAISLIINTLKFITNFNGDIPGRSKKECGNYLEHSLSKAKFYAKNLLTFVDNWSENNLHYK